MPGIKFKQSSTQTMNLSTTPTSITLSNIGGAVLLQNIGSSIAHMRFGATSPVNAAGNDLCLVNGTERIVRIDPINDLHIGGRTDASTTTVKVTELDSIS